ncbi:hypothetical protein ABID22_003675 [Pontibacter aydingkolensis]|uniref:Uncharacterized protein n=1 Tax=Pontibacter aydingkolensis TaxID=1911536 RepID=A0ABS7CYY3_9BACT|nr:hypothetical protein [Pontibacter aydingkolensis]MBW7468975.1 hypothetical protein [Pontibacter aydingkolensis]
MRKEISAYNQQNILPVIWEQRYKLDAEITVNDKTEIDRLHAEQKNTGKA